MMQSSYRNTGRMSLRNSALLTIGLCSAIHSFGQKKKKVKEPVEYPIVKVLDKDSVMIFTIEQSRELARRNEERLKLQSDAKITKSQMNFKDSIILKQQKEITDLMLIKFDYDQVVKEMARQQKICSDEKVVLNNAIDKQRRHKNISILSGVLSFGTMLYFYIHKQ